MKKIDVDIYFRCNECFPEVDTEKEHGSNWTFNVLICTTGKKKYKDNMYCKKCKKLLGSYYVSKKYKII